MFTTSEPPPPRLDDRGSHASPTPQSARLRSTSPKSPRSRPVIPADEDATMPPTELSGLD
jgi:hypothetical protein